MKHLTKISAFCILSMILLSGCNTIQPQGSFVSNQETSISGTVITETDSKPVISADDSHSDNATYLFENLKSAENSGEHKYQLSFSAATERIMQTLDENSIQYEQAKFVCAEISALDEKKFYNIMLAYDNGDTLSVMGRFLVDANDGTVYLIYDPIIDANSQFATLAGNVDTNDYRTRIILLG